MSLGVGLLEERNPSLILISALREEKSLGASLIRLAVNILVILTIDLLQKISLHRGGIPQRRLEIEFIVDDGVDPFAISIKDKAVDADLCVMGNADPL